MKTQTNVPVALQELAASRVAYCDGRFLMSDIMGMAAITRGRIVQWAVDNKHPATFQPTTTTNLIALLAREEYARQQEAR